MKKIETDYNFDKIKFGCARLVLQGASKREILPVKFRFKLFTRRLYKLEKSLKRLEKDGIKILVKVDFPVEIVTIGRIEEVEEEDTNV